MKKLFFLAALFLVVSFMQSCEKDTVENPDDLIVPTLPPQETFIMPFTGYEDLDTTGFTSPQSELEERGGPTSFRNWFYAGSNVFVWNVVLGVSMAVPVASFREAFNHTPTYDGNGAFVWSYDYTLAGATYIAALSGRFVNNNQDVEWVMNISKVGGFANVEWYRGVVARDHSGGTWTLNHRPENPEPLITIDYDKNVATGVFSIRYTNIIPGNPDNGDYIIYTTEAGDEFNRSYDFFRGDDDFLEIEWKAPTNEGRVRNPKQYGDNDWHCWNTELQDIDC